MECYICYDKETSSNQFENSRICNCKGTNKIHKKCLEKMKRTCGNTCTICKTKYRAYDSIYENKVSQIQLEAYTADIWEEMQLWELLGKTQSLEYKRKKVESCTIS